MRFFCGVVLCALLAQAPGASASRPTLGVILTTAPHVTGATRDTLIEEATRIWTNAGVRLDWIPPSMPRPSTRQTVRLLAVPWEAVPASADATVLGELLRGRESNAVVMVSLDEAERIVGRLSRPADLSRDERAGIILGRAAAHEIGHYLLNTSTHADRGLMRARFGEQEFADPQSHAFELDEQARAWLHHRLQKLD